MVVRSTTDRVVRVCALAVDIALCSWARHSHRASLHPGVQMGTANYMLG